VSKATDLKFADILRTALAAGAAAGAACIPVPMVVSQHANPLNDRSPVTKGYLGAEGACGFGWVSFAGNTAFGRWAKKNGHARSDYPTGLRISSKLMTQSMYRNEAWATAVAETLRNAGIEASAQSRID
jgi:hypothetical protein